MCTFSQIIVTLISFLCKRFLPLHFTYHLVITIKQWFFELFFHCLLHNYLESVLHNFKLSMNNFEKWPNILEKSCGVSNAIFLKHIWLFCNILSTKGLGGIQDPGTLVTIEIQNYRTSGPGNHCKFYCLISRVPQKL